MLLVSIFVEGLLSFLSPCVLPLVPLYMSYLSSGGKEIDEDGNTKYKTAKVFITTVFFVLGISTVFLLLAISVNAIKPLIEKYSNVVSIIGGVIVIAFGLHETGIIKISFIASEKRINLKVNTERMNYLKAFILGFLFSFAWTPCIGPMLSSAIILASTTKIGSLYILVYALGLVIPFLITGLFTSTVLNFIKNKKNILKYTMIIAGIIMIIYGSYMIVNAVKDMNTVAIDNSSENVTAKKEPYLPDNVFYDQNDNEIRFEDYNDKYIILNFTATWCTYCKAEIPEYLSFAKENNDVYCFYVMSPSTSRVDIETVKSYIAENNIDIPVIIDVDNILVSYCNPSAYPCLFVTNKEGKFLGYIAGSMNEKGFDDILSEAIKRDSSAE